MQQTAQSNLDTLAEVTGSMHPLPEAKNRKPWGRWFLVLAVIIGSLFALAVMFVIIGGVLFGARSFESNAPGPVELPLVEGAPEADIVMVVTPSGASGPNVDQQFLDANMGTGQPLEPGSAIHIADVMTPYDSYQLFRWSELSTTKGLIGDVQLCSGGMGNRGGYAGCGGSDVATTEPSIGSGITQSGSEVSFSLSVDNLDPGAKWLVVDTESGFRAATEIVEGMGYLEWPAGGPVQADPIKIRALDEEMIEIWSAPVQ